MVDYAWQIGSGLLGGLIACLVSYSILSFKLFRLAFTVAGLQQAILTLRNTSNVNKRWSKQEADDQALMDFARTNTGKSEKFANDPIPWG